MFSCRKGLALLLTMVSGLSLTQSSLQAQAAWTGVQRLLILSIRCSDELEPHPAPDEVERSMARVRELLGIYSYGRMSLSWTVVEANLPKPDSEYNAQELMQAARAVAFQAGQSPYLFNFVAYRASRYIIARGHPGEIFIPDLSPEVAVHELGHGMGLPHARGAAFKNGPLLGAGTLYEYGNLYDMMGGALNSVPAESAHFNALFKLRLGWLYSRNVRDVNQNGIYELTPLDSETVPAGAIFALRLKRTETEDFWVEVRAQPPGPYNGNGVLISLSERDDLRLRSDLIDTTPGEENSDESPWTRRWSWGAP